jgi:hypothetical protein
MEKADFVAEQIMGWHMEHDGQWWVDATDTWMINVDDYAPYDEADHAIDAVTMWQSLDNGNRYLSVSFPQKAGDGFLAVAAQFNGAWLTSKLEWTASRRGATMAMAICDVLIAAVEEQ